MRKLFAIFALLGVLLQSFNSAIIVLGYYANKEYIAKYLCENKDKPRLNCEGKCSLKKRLAKEISDQVPGQRNQKNEEPVTLFCEYRDYVIYSLRPIYTRQVYFTFNDLTLFDFCKSVFRPPAFYC